jgi:hypothetical protein
VTVLSANLRFQDRAAADRSHARGRDILAVNTAYTCICRIDGFARSLAYHSGYLFVDPPPPEPEPDAPRTPALAATR